VLDATRPGSGAAGPSQDRVFEELRSDIASPDFPQASPSASSAGGEITIIVRPALDRDGRALGDLFEARLGGQVIVRARSPFLAAARKLIDLGVDPSTVLVMRHAGSASESLRGRIGKAAAVAAEERNDGRKPPRFVAWRPQYRAGGSPGIAQTRSRASQQSPAGDAAWREGPP
jgi:hypothetical protein